MNEEIENKGASNTNSISSDVEAGQTQTIDIITPKDIEKNEAKINETENVKPQNVVTNEKQINVNVTTNSGKNKKQKKNRNTRSFLLVLIVLLIIVITIGLIYLKILDIKEKYKIEKPVESVFDETITRKESDESKFLVKFGDKYNVNDIKFTMYYDYDGKVTTESEPSNNFKLIRTYYQIEGLKDKVVQESVNSTIKNVAYSINPTTEGKIYINTHINGNFANILSIMFSYYEENSKVPTYKTLNFNLCDGSLIKFEDLFINSAPIASLLTDGCMKAKAWKVDLDYDSMTDEEYFARQSELYNMDNRDFSNAEDYGIEVANLYKQKKNDIEFAVGPKGVVVYNFNPSFLGNDHRPIYISFRDNIVNIAAYKRFLTSSSIYEEDIRPNDVFVFTSILSFYDSFYVNSGNIYINVYCGQTEDKALQQLLKDEINTRVMNELKAKANANPDKKFVITGYAYTTDFRYGNFYNAKDRYKNSYLEFNGVKKEIHIGYNLEIMDNMNDERFGEIMAAVDSLPSASAEAYPINYIVDGYLADEYKYLNLPKIDFSRISESFYYKENNDYFISYKDLPSDEDLEKYYFDNELYNIGVDYGS